MNATRFIPLIVALVLGLAGVFFGRNLLERYQSAQHSAPGTSKVIIAKSDLAPGRQVQAGDLGTIAIPPEAVPPNAIRSSDKAAGRVALAPISKGQILIDSLLAESSSGLGIQALVPPGMRAVCIDVSDSGGMIGQLIPGSRVDVMITLVDEKLKRTVTRTIVENVKVVAVGVDTSPKDPQAQSAASALKPSAPVKAKSVTLMVTPRQAEAIELATSKGRPRLALRGGQDNNTVRSEGVTIAELTGGDPSALYERGGQMLGSFLAAMQARQAASPTTRPAEATAVAAGPLGTGVAAGSTSAAPQPVPAIDNRPMRRSIQLIKGGKESTTQLEITPAAAAELANATRSDSQN